MAYTVTIVKTVLGNERVHHLKIVADAATQTVETGLKVIDGMVVGVCSAATTAYLNGGVRIYPNSNATGTQSMGVLGISNATSGDTLYVTVFGR